MLLFLFFPKDFSQTMNFTTANTPASRRRRTFISKIYLGAHGSTPLFVSEFFFSAEYVYLVFYRFPTGTESGEASGKKLLE